MPKRKRDALTDVQVRQVKPREKPYKLADGRGLYLFVKPNGSRLWRMDIKVSDRWVTLSFGEYPLISLKEARDKRDDTLKLKREGRDPVQVKKAKEAAQEADLATFEVVAREWQAMAAKAWTPDYATGILRRLEKWVFPYVGGCPMGKLTSPEILSVCHRVEAKSAYTAHRVLQLFGKVFRFAVAKGLVGVNPALGLSDVLTPHQEEHRATLTDPKAIGILLRAMDGYTGDILTRAALRLTPYLILRPGELRSLEWAMIHFDVPEIRFPGKRMKMKTLPPHIVPLARQAVEVLMDIHPVTGKGRYVFPSVRKDGRPMSENTVRSALIRLGYRGDEQTAHGFRAMADTLLNEMGFNRDAIERQLAHGERNKVRAAYNHAEHLPERRRMMQKWADYLDKLRGQK